MERSKHSLVDLEDLHSKLGHSLFDIGVIVYTLSTMTL